MEIYQYIAASLVETTQLKDDIALIMKMIHNHPSYSYITTSLISLLLHEEETEGKAQGQV